MTFGSSFNTRLESAPHIQLKGKVKSKRIKELLASKCLIWNIGLLTIGKNFSTDVRANIYALKCFDFNPPIITNTVNSMMVEVLPNFTPAAAFNYSTMALDISFADASTNEPDTWLWEFGDGNSSPLQNPEHTYAADGTYNVCLTVANDWGSTQYCEELTVSLTSTHGISDNSAIQLHPNPANTQIWIDASNWPLPQQLVVYNTAGKVVQSIVVETKKNL